MTNTLPGERTLQRQAVARLNLPAAPVLVVHALLLASIAVLIVWFQLFAVVA